jgi:hypothetical protein
MASVKRAQKYAGKRRFLTAAYIILAAVMAGVIASSSYRAPAANAAGTTVNGDASCGYAGTTQFTESTVMRWAQVNGSGLSSQFIAYANDENSMLLGVNTAPATNTSPDHEGPGVSGGDPTQHDGVALGTGNLPGSSAQQPRPYYPALYITPVSGQGSWLKPGDTIPQALGDWQQGGTPRNVSAGQPFVTDVFGTWVVGTQTANPGPAPGLVGTLANGPLSTTLNTTHLDLQSPLTATVYAADSLTVATTGHTLAFVATGGPYAPGATSINVVAKKSNFAFPNGSTITDTTAQTGNYARQATLPTKNDWNLGTFNPTPGATGPNADQPVGQTFSAMGTEGYGTEFRWNVNQLTDYQGHALAAGQYYKVQVVEHDGDQNKGGDSGEFCTLVKIPGSPPVVTHPGVSGDAQHIAEPLGSTINDHATVSPNPGFPNPTGQVTFHLYFIPLGDNTAPASACDVVHDTGFSQTKDLTVGNPSTASTSPGYNTTGHGLGTYVWLASYDPHGDTNYTAGSETCGTETDQMITARIKLGPHDATNAVGTVHTVTATLETTPDNSTYTAVSGATINFTISGSSTGAGPNAHLAYVSPGSASCTTGAAGTCTTKINDDTAETVTIHASATGFTQPNTTPAVQGAFSGTFATSSAGGTCTSDANGASECDALKHYDIGRILLSPEDASNAAGANHTITATLQYSGNGTTWTNAGSGQTITFSIVPANPNVSFVPANQNTCSTGAGGSCSVTINDTHPETVGIHASSTFSVTGIGGTFSVATSAANCDTSAGSANNGTCDAVKHYIVGRILLTPESAINLAGNPHTYTATLQTSPDGTTWTTISEAGKTINFQILSSTPNNSGVFVDGTHGLPNGLGQGTAGNGSQNGAVTCSTNGLGACNVTINDPKADTDTIRANSAFSLTGIGGTFTVSTTAGGAGGTCDTGAGGVLGGTCDAIKVYINPSTTEHVTDTLADMPADTTGSVQYQAYSTLADCNGNTGANRLLNETDTIATAGTMPTSGSVDVPKGVSIWWRVTYTGSGAGNYGSYTSQCTETASSS